MKGKFYTVGMLAIALALGFVFTGCDTGANDPTPPSTAYLNEKAWVCNDSGSLPSGITSATMVFSGTNQWVETFNGSGPDNGKTVNGTYTVSGLTITWIIGGGDMPGRPINGTVYTATFDATQATKFTVTDQNLIFNRQP